jgi:hypothetical protein
VSLYAKREPWPFSIKIDGTGLLLGSPGPNQPAMVSSKTQDISQVAPPDYSYAGLSPLSERVEPYESLALGMGLPTQDKWQDFRYAQAMGVDCSVWPWCTGPDVVDSSGACNGEVADFFELGGALYAAGGTQVLRYTPGTDTWTVAHDFGAGAPIAAAVVFASNFDGVPRAWVGFGDGRPAQYSSDGTTWTAMATFTALAFGRVGREWWWAANVNHLRKCDTNADPTLEDNYTTDQFTIGDASSPITSLMVSAAGTLIIAKTDGLYSLNATGDDLPLFPFLRFGPSARNGVPWGQFMNDLYVGYGQVFSRLGPDLVLQDIGTARLVNNTGPVRGMITTFCGVGDMFAYAILWNPDTSTSYLLKFGGFYASGDLTSGSTGGLTTSGNAVDQRVDAWHGALNHGWAGSYGSQLFVSAIGAPAGHTRTYCGFSDGTLRWWLNPCVPNPAACSQYRFEPGDQWVDLPLWHGTYHASAKSVRSLVVSAPRLDAANFVSIEYATSPSAPLVPAPQVFDTPVLDVVALPTNTTAVLAAFRVHLHVAANTSCPLVSSVAISHALRPRRIMQYDAEILCADGLMRRDGVPMRMGRTAIRQFVEAAVDNPGAIAVVLPDETRQDMSVIDYQLSQAFDEVGRQWRGSLHLKMVQWSIAEA